MASPAHCPPELTLVRLSVDQYHAMRDAGILGESDEVELLEGLLVPKMSKLPRHSVACTLIKDALERAVTEGFHLRVQDPITTPDSEPEPDVAVVKGRPRDYLLRHPYPGDVLLVIEVADESLARDRGTKLRLYARAGVPEYWIVNLRDRCIERHRQPEGERYGTCDVTSMGGRIELVLGDAARVEFEVDALVP